MSSQQLKFLVGGLVVVAALGILMAVSFQGNMAYYVDVDEFMTEGSTLRAGNLRVRGVVVPGTIEKKPGELGARFLMGDQNGEATRTMRVRYHKELPDTFVDGAEVVVEGELGGDRVFEAHTLLAKCPSKYEAEIEGEHEAVEGT